MKISNFFKANTLEKRLVRVMIAFALIMEILFIIVSHIQIAILGNMVRHENKEQSQRVQDEYKLSMEELANDTLRQLIIWAADKTDDEFWILDHDLRVFKSQVEDVFEHPEEYDRVKVSTPKKENQGKYVLQMLYPNGEENADPQTVEMLERVANLGPMMAEIVGGNSGYTMDCFVSAPDGVTLAMDALSGDKYEENGKIKDYDATNRPWYQGAVESGDRYISASIESFLYDYREVIFSYPIYVENKLVAVVEACTRFEVMEETIFERKVGKDGFSILISQTGQLVCSGKKEGELKVPDDKDADIRQTVNTELKAVIDRAMAQETAVEMVMVDGELYYVAYAPIDIVGWTLMSFVSAKEVHGPANTIMNRVENSTEDTLNSISMNFRKYALVTVAVILMIMLICVTFISFLARRRIRPIKMMTDAVKDFVVEDMEFEMEREYMTGDEIQDLAESIAYMSGKMKEYVREIVDNTTERERLGAEMEAASQIQLKMLPKREPNFYNKPGYNLFAKAVPARNVGGDLYDFYYIDDDHMAIVLGDVSGKGITAALFMTLCKQTLKYQVLLHNTDLVSAMAEANERLTEDSVDAMFITVWIGIVTLSTGELQFVNAGHMYACIKRGNSDFVLMDDNHSMLMGAVDIDEFALNTTTLEKGDIIYLYTDGVTEANNSQGDMFGEDRLLEALNEAKDLSVEEIDDRVRARVAEFVGDTEQSDDITTLCFEYKG